MEDEPDALVDDLILTQILLQLLHQTQIKDLEQAFLIADQVTAPHLVALLLISRYPSRILGARPVASATGPLTTKFLVLGLHCEHLDAIIGLFDLILTVLVTGVIWQIDLIETEEGLLGYLSRLEHDRISLSIRVVVVLFIG